MRTLPARRPPRPWRDGARRAAAVAVAVAGLCPQAMGWWLCMLSPDVRAESADVPGAQWHIVAPADSTSWPKDKLDALQAYVDDMGSTAALIVQHGAIVAAWGDVAHPSNLHSGRKSLLDALFGIAVAEGRIHLDDTLATLGVDDRPPALTMQEKQATVRQLLQARSGVYHAAAYETRGMHAQKPPRGSHAPGTFWYYNNWDFNTLGHVYEQARGLSIFEAFADEIARPLQMQDYRAADGQYVHETGSDFPAYLFQMSARDLARFALLYLHGGRWGDVQLVPRDWVQASTRPYSAAPSGGYGYLWWTADAPGGETPAIRFPAGSYWVEGHLGQFAVVVPALDLIVVNLVDGNRTRHTVSKRQMAELVRRVVESAPH